MHKQEKAELRVTSAFGTQPLSRYKAARVCSERRVVLRVGRFTAPCEVWGFSGKQLHATCEHTSVQEFLQPLIQHAGSQISSADSKQLQKDAWWMLTANLYLSTTRYLLSCKSKQCLSHIWSACVCVCVHDLTHKKSKHNQQCSFLKQ